MEVLAIIEHIQKCLKRTVTDDEIQNGILRDLLTKEDYDIVKVVSTYLLSSNTQYFQKKLQEMPQANMCVHLQRELRNYVRDRFAMYLQRVSVRTTVFGGKPYYRPS